MAEKLCNHVTLVYIDGARYERTPSFDCVIQNIIYFLILRNYQHICEKTCFHYTLLCLAFSNVADPQLSTYKTNCLMFLARSQGQQMNMSPRTF